MITRRETEPVRADRRAARIAGVAAMAPMAAGVAPYGLVVGAAVARAPEPAAGLLSTWGLFSGSAQLSAMQLLHDGAAVAVVVASVLVMNLRLIVYSGALAPRWRT